MKENIFPSEMKLNKTSDLNNINYEFLKAFKKLMKIDTEKSI